MYLACNDTQGNIKVLKTLKRDSGIRLGIAHAGDWPTRGQRKLEYEVLLGSFTGDWYDAADLYRDWTLRQKWATPLGKRGDIPKWLLDSPVYVTIRPQSYDDDTSTLKIKEFLPYEKCIPLLGPDCTRHADAGVRRADGLGTPGLVDLSRFFSARRR